MIPAENTTFYLNKIKSDAYFKGALGQSSTMAHYSNKGKALADRYKICKHIYAMIPITIYVQKDFYLLEAFNEKLEQFKASGLIEFWHLSNLDTKSAKTESLDYEKALKMQQLMGSFQLLELGWLFSILAFITELLISALTR